MIKIRDFTMNTYILLFILILTGCQAPPEPIVMKDLNTLSQIAYSATLLPEDWPVVSEEQIVKKTDAGDTAVYILLKAMIYDFEKDLFDKLKVESDLMVINDLNQYDLVIDVNAGFDEAEADDIATNHYQLVLDTRSDTGYLINKLHSVKIDKYVDEIYNSELLPLMKSELPLPLTTITLGQQVVDFNVETEMTYTLYKNRFVQKKLSQLSDTVVEILSEPITELQISYHPQMSAEPSSLIYKITEQGSDKVIKSGEIEKPYTEFVIPLPENNGLYHFDITSLWEDDDICQGKEHYTFDINIEVSEEFSANKEYYEPGDLVVIKGEFLDTDLNYNIESDIYHEELKFLPFGDSGYLIIPLMSKTEPGSYKLKITDPDYPDQMTTLDISVIHKDFEEQYLETSSSTASLRNEEAYAQMYEAFARGRENLSEVPYWEGPFMQPVEGRISTEYGEIRYTNGDTVSSRHSGIDFAVPQGTVIYAPENGYITLSEELTITGNTLFIDHGFGIVSQCYHLYTIYAEVGDYVEKGDPIAEVGSTGYSTGAHLHYSIYLNGIYVNPWKLFEKVPF